MLNINIINTNSTPNTSIAAPTFPNNFVNGIAPTAPIIPPTLSSVFPCSYARATVSENPFDNCIASCGKYTICIKTATHINSNAY